MTSSATASLHSNDASSATLPPLAISPTAVSAIVTASQRAAGVQIAHSAWSMLRMLSFTLLSASGLPSGSDAGGTPSVPTASTSTMWPLLTLGCSFSELCQVDIGTVCARLLAMPALAQTSAPALAVLEPAELVAGNTAVHLCVMCMLRVHRLLVIMCV